MGKWYLRPGGSYYFGDRADWVDVEIQDQPFAGAVYSGGEWISPVPLVSMVETERDRRLATAPFEYDFGDARGVHVIGTDEKDMKAWIDEVMPTAQARLNLGDTTPISIVTNTGPVDVTPLEWMAIINAGSAPRQAIWAAYFALIHTDPIPADYADDQYWP